MQIFIEDLSNIYSDEKAISQHLTFLSNEEKQSFDNKKRKKQQLQFLLGRFLLRTKLSEILGKKAKDIQIIKQTSGRLELKDNHSNINFNISHSNDLVALAIGNKPVGIDIEFMKQRDFYNIANSSFSEEEAKAIKNTTNDSDKMQLFYKYWTTKECLIKYQENKDKEPPIISFICADKYMLSIACEDNELTIITNHKFQQYSCLFL